MSAQHPMMPEDADQLAVWVEQMTTEQLRALWRWVFLVWEERIDHYAPRGSLMTTTAPALGEARGEGDG